MTDVTYRPPGDFHRTLKSRVDEYFAGASRRGARGVQVKCAVITVWLASSYALYLGAASPWLLAMAGLSIGLAMAAVGFNIQHDGGHGTFSRGRVVNRLAAFSLDLLGGSSYVWRWKHNYFHHTFPNVDGVDSDVDLGVVGRLSAVRPWRIHHRFQKVYLWILYGLLPTKWQFFDDFHDVIRGRIGGQPFPPPRGGELVALLAGKIAFALLAFGAPLLRHDAPAVIGVYALASFVCGVTLSVIFQLAHCVDGVQTPLLPRDVAGSDWAAHQVASTANFAPGNGLVTWYTGALNFQIEHHLFPGIAHTHYPKLAPLVRRTCEEFGVRYVSHPTLRSALAAHQRLLARFGLPDALPLMA
jgi:linoleoyl-CoA desaturase